MISTRATLASALALAFTMAACAEQEPEADDSAADSAAIAPAPAPAQTTGAMLDPNNASRDDLLALGTVQATLVDTLIAHRPFTSMVAVDSVLAGTLDEEQRDSVYTRVWMPIDLNTATDEEILLIPGIGDRMLHEFKEYRPYRAMEQFRREIGKYVDEAEVARLERYVTIR